MEINQLDLPILARVSKARNLDKFHKNLNGILVEPYGEGKVCVVATDGFCLAWATVRLKNNSDVLPEPVLIPAPISESISRVKPRASVSRHHDFQKTGMSHPTEAVNRRCSLPDLKRT